MSNHSGYEPDFGYEIKLTAFRDGNKPLVYEMRSTMLKDMISESDLICTIPSAWEPTGCNLQEC